MTNTKQAGRFDALTGFRCLAACLVFIYHNRKFWRQDLHPEILRLFNEMHIGVSLFFVLSGFLIAYTYADKPMKSLPDYGRYFGLRLARILPVYWLILTLFYLDPAYGKMEFSWLTYSLLHGYSDNLNLDGIAQAWSLSVEACFYIFCPLLFWLLRKKAGYFLLALILLFAAFYLTGIIWQQVNGNPRSFFQPFQFLLVGSFPGRSSEFAAGMLLAWLMQNGKLKTGKPFRYKTTAGFCGILVSAYLIGLFQSAEHTHGYDTWQGMLLSKTVLPFCTVLALAGLMEERTWAQRLLSSRLLVLLGNASYIFYLVHLSYVNMKLKGWLYLPDRNFVLLWLLSILLYVVYEKPVYNWFRKKLKRKEIN